MCPIRSQCCTNKDAPTGALDTNTGQEVLALLQTMSREKMKTVIMVTHNNMFAEIATKVIKVKNGRVESVTENLKPKSANEVKW